MKNIVIFGSSGYTKVIIDIIEKVNNYRIVGLIDPYEGKGTNLFGYTIIGSEENIEDLRKEYNFDCGIIAIGDNWRRKEVFERVRKRSSSFTFIKAIHPSVQIGKDVTIGEGTVLMAGVIANSATEIGRFCIINTNASLDHDCIMEDFSSLAPNATLGGNIKIGQYSSISLGANIIHEINIGAHSIIGAGTLVNKDIPDLVVAYGVPAKIIRKRKIGDTYL